MNLWHYLRRVLRNPANEAYRTSLAAAMIASDIDAIGFGDEVWVLRGDTVTRMPLAWNPHRVEVDVAFTEFIKSGLPLRLGKVSPAPTLRAIDEAAFWAALSDEFGCDEEFVLDDRFSITDMEIEI
jgi:hypothetical protein